MCRYSAFDNTATTAAWWFFLVLKTLYSFAWDVRMDWGLGHMQHGFLRPSLCFPRKWYQVTAAASYCDPALSFLQMRSVFVNA